MRIKNKPVRDIPERNTEAGFTLIELAIVMSISALVLISILQVYMSYRAHYDHIRARNIVTAANEAIGNFYSQNINKRYPCPADPTLPLTNVLAGVENCSLATVNGARQTESTATQSPRPALDPVMVGALPFKTLNIPMSEAVDSWGGKLMYAVSKAQTVKETFHDNFGAIRVETEAGNSLAAPENGAHYVVFSLGKNKNGSYLASGKRSSACATGLAESKNCQLQSTYVQGLMSPVDGAAYFDDLLMYSSRTIVQLWDFNTLGSGIVTYPLISGNVGVGVADPRTKLHVGGTVRATQSRQEEICDDSTPPRCWSPTNFGGATGTRCPAAPSGSVYPALGIQSGQIACSTTPVGLPKPSGEQSCPPGQYVAGFTFAGAIVCKGL